MSKKRKHRPEPPAASPLQPVADYVRDLACRLHLSDWNIGVSNRQASEDCEASIEVNVRRHCATIRLGLDFPDRAPDEQRQTIVHELLHCHFQPVENTIDAVQTNLGEIWGVLHELHHDHVEIAIDHLADVIAPAMPLPAFRKEDITR